MPTSIPSSVFGGISSSTASAKRSTINSLKFSAARRQVHHPGNLDAPLLIFLFTGKGHGRELYKRQPIDARGIFPQ